MIVKEGEKFHAILRRAFEQDLRRHFVGCITAVSELAFRADGYAFVYNRAQNRYVRKPEKRTRLFPLTDAALLVNLLPRDADIEKAQYTLSGDNRLIVTDGEHFSLDINEFGVSS